MSRQNWWLVSLSLVALIPSVGPGLDISSTQTFAPVRLIAQSVLSTNPNAPTSATVSMPNHANSTAGAAPAHPNAAVSSGASGALPPPSQEIPALRTQTSDTYVVSGGNELISYSGPINYKSAQGSWQPIDDSLVTSNAAGFAWQNKANGFSLLLPPNLGGPVEFKDASGSVSFQLQGAGSATGQVSGSMVTYPNAIPGVTVQLSAGNAGIKESVILTGSASPSQVSYSMTLSSGMNAAASASGGVAISGQSGELLYSIDPPSASDAAGASTPSVTMALSGSGASRNVSLSLDSAWLASSGRLWPVTIDPSINYNADQDCAIANGSHANTNYCGSGIYLKVGYDGTYIWRSALLFNIQNSVPVGAQVTHAGLAMYLQSASTTNYGSLSAHQLTQSWTNGLTWNNYDGSHAWTSAGGTFNSAKLASLTPSTAGWYYWEGSAISTLAQSWLSNPTNINDGLMVTADNEANNEADTLGSTRIGSTPYFYVYYTNAIGTRSFYNQERHQLTDHSNLAVNVANGNLTIQGVDLSIQGTGLNLQVNRMYNSLGSGGAMGTWVMTTGVDVNLAFLSGDVYYQGPGGYDATFRTNGSGGWNSPPGINAVLSQSGSNYKLTFNSSHETLNFNSSGQLTSDADRNGDTISYTYSSGLLSSISDTQSRSTTFAYTSSVASNLVSGITDSTSRTWGYTYASASGFHELTQYTDPNTKSTQYSYDTSGRVTKITDPLGNQTTFGYDSASRVTSITRVTDNVHGTGPTTNYTYNTGAGTCGTPPTGESFFGNTVSEDANSHSTTYCYDPSGLVLKVIDANGNARISTFTADANVATLADGLSQVSTLAYDNNNNLASVTAPASGSGQTAAKSTFGYSTPSTVAGYQYLSSSLTNPQSKCTAYAYDTSGNLTDSYAGQTSPCDGNTGGTHVQNKYQGDSGVSCGAKTGELCSSTDGGGNTTSYGFDSNGNVTSITPPSPLGATTIVPDSLSRVSSVTDGKSQKTSYTYDTLDRITQLLYNGATSCSSYTTCIQYNYDADGNLTSRVDNTGTTSFYYDALNRVTTQALPSGGSACSGSSPTGITYGYDGVGNLTEYCDSGGATNYGYDPGNNLTSMYEPGGNCGGTPSLCTKFLYDGDNHRTKSTFPGGATLTTTYDNAGHVLTVIGKDKNASTLTSFTYTYNVGTQDTQYRQTMVENDAVANNTYSYSYDVLNRLTAANVTAGSGTSYSYTYDSNGNRTRQTAGSTTTSYAYNAANEICWAYSGSSSNACSSAPTGAVTYSFDANGNETASSSSDSLSYNSKNQTTSITHGGTTLSGLTYADAAQTQRTVAGSTEFANTPLGVQVSTTSGTSTYYTHDSNGNLLGERLGSAHWYYLTDGSGSIVAVTTGDGLTIGDRYGYDPYGNATTHTGTTANPWGYAGGYTDTTGLIKFGTRYYDPSLGRWTQQDSIGGSITNPNTLDRYNYVACNPINAVDPSGKTCWAGAVAAGVTLFGIVVLGVAGVAGLPEDAPAWIGVALFWGTIASAIGGIIAWDIALRASTC
jgi:RHS repeat-associated protein